MRKESPMRHRRAVVARLSAIVAALALFCAGSTALVQADLIDHQIMIVTFDTGTGLLAGLARDGSPIAATLSPDTHFRTARSDRFTPTDPCKPLAEAYNPVVPPNNCIDCGNFPALFDAIASLATSSCGAKVII